MFRLIKLLAYAALGYIIYELYQGMTEGGGRRAVGGGQRGSMGAGSRGEFAGGESAGAAMTGGGSGMMADVAEDTGAESQRPVGRGVR